MKKEKYNVVTDNTIDLYFKDIKGYETMSYEEEYELWKDYKENGNEESKNKLLEANLKFVASVAKSYQGMGLSYADLIAEGNVGLMRAIRKFDGDKGYKFISYAVHWIKQSIREALDKRNTMDTDDLPVNQESNDFDNDKESMKCSSDNYLYEENLEPIRHKEEIKVVGLLMNYLSDKEKIVVSKYYGLNGAKQKTLDEIGQELGLTKERVRQINEKSFKKMRSAALNIGIDENIYQL